MSKISNAWKTLVSAVNNYKEFGASGFSFVFKLRSRKQGLVHIKPFGMAHNIQLRNTTEDVPMFYGVFKDKEFDIPFGFEPKVIIDCGAHIGLTSVYYANKYPSSKIYAIEPEKSNFEILLKNTSPYSNITCLNYGVWYEPSNLSVVDVNEGNWGFQTKPTTEKIEGSIEAVTIPMIMSKYGIQQIDVCKINIEGAEKELFEHNYEWLAATKTIVIELHDRMKEGCANSFFNALSQYKFWLDWKGAYLVVHLQH